MARPKKKFYVVWIGRETGVFESWDECKTQVFGFPGARYKSYPDLKSAKKALKQGPPAVNRKSSATDKKSNTKGIVLPSISVDAACSGNPGIMEYRAVYTDSALEIFHRGPYQHGTNNIGEFLALVLAIIRQEKRKEPTTIYSDSRTALAWLRNKKVNTKLERTSANKKMFEEVDLAIDWLKENKYSSKIEKWNTKAWGEIPADFGRK